MTIFDDLWSAPMSTRGHLTYRRDDVRLDGLDTGTVTVIARRNTPGLGVVLTLHEAGSSYWSGYGCRRGYSGAHTYTILVEPDTRRYVRLSNPAQVRLSDDERSQLTRNYTNGLDVRGHA